MIEPLPLLRTLVRTRSRTCCIHARRHISVNSAINRALRESSRPDTPAASSKGTAPDNWDPVWDTPFSDEDNVFLKQKDEPKPRLSRKERRANYKERILHQNPVEGRIRYHASEGWDAATARGEEPKHSETLRPRQAPGKRENEFVPSPVKVNPTLPPQSLRYTTAASEFLYGHSSVFAALKANRRRLYNLYLLPRAKSNEDYIALRARANQLALYSSLKIHDVSDAWINVLDKASGGRPHNGFVLEASPLPRSPIMGLVGASRERGTFRLDLGEQTKEDLMINGAKEEYKYKSNDWRYPLILYVDGVEDPGNLGAMMRSAYFLGVDAIVLAARGTASLQPTVLKVSAGAAEAIPVFTAADPVNFLENSAREGWRIYASAMIERPVNGPERSSSSRGTPTSSSAVFSYARGNMPPIQDHYPLAMHPTILMMGSEEKGLSRPVLGKAHYKVGIAAGREDEVGVDSLNVSVATALLCYEFLKKPKQTRKPGDFLF